MTIHDMDSSLRRSHEHADATWWREIYSQAFPDMISRDDLRSHGWHQLAGRDRAIHLSTGRTLYVDEKVRDNVYDDILIEVWSVYPPDREPPYQPVEGAVPGWAVAPKDCDYLAYAFVPTRTCYLFPYFGIRAAWEKHGGLWRAKATTKKDGYDWKPAKNRRLNGTRYDTINIPVPIEALRSCISDAMTITWKAAA